MNLKKDLAVVGGLFLAIVILMLFGKEYTSISLLTNQNQSTPSAQTLVQTQARNGKIDVNINTLTVKAEVADTKKNRQKGLSEKEDMPISDGMLFVFKEAKPYGIWMKDMKFPIDIIWISGDKKIVHIVENATPQPNTDDKDLDVFTPQENALYILEINAGLAYANRLNVGDNVKFTY